jgi:uncharacterized membrane protein (DUF373 family)
MRPMTARRGPTGQNVAMTSESGPDDTDQPGRPGGGQAEHRGPRVVRQWIWLLEHAQDVVAVAVGAVLIALAITILIAGVVDFIDRRGSTISTAASLLLDRVLLVLILVEIVYTVVLTLRAHRLVAQPFIVVGLIAVIRRILVVFTPESHVTVGATELALLIGMVAFFVAALVAVSFVEKDTGLGIGRLRARPGADSDDAGGGGSDAAGRGESG